MARSKYTMVGALLLAVLSLTACNANSPTGQPSGQALVSGTPLPTAIGTVPRPEFPTPIATGSVEVPGTREPIPTQRPPATFGIEQFIHTPQAVTTLSQEPIALSSDATPMVWSVEAKDTLTLWLGYVSSGIKPSVKNAHPIVRWDGGPHVLSLAPSPDRLSLAILLTGPWTEMNTSNYLWIVNLSNNTVMSLPNLKFQEAYKSYYSTENHYIIGWLDDNRVALQTNLAPAIMAKDGSTFTKITWLPQPGQMQTALSPDRTTFFSEVISNDSGFWLYKVDGSAPRNLSGNQKFKPIYAPSWSPDGKHVSFLTSLDGGSTSLQLGLLGTADGKQQTITPERGWDAAPAWSPDGTTIAFLRADDSGAYRDYAAPEQVSTNIFIVKADGSATTQLTHFNGAKNRDLSWSADGSYLVLSSAVSSATSGIVAVSLNDGAVTTLVPASDGADTVFPLLIK
jgi:WD40-like Beta Propeller Repeat